MDSGKAVEFDEPHILLQKSTGIFHGMVKALGPKEFQRLSQVALEKFNHSSDMNQCFIKNILLKKLFLNNKSMPVL